MALQKAELAPFAFADRRYLSQCRGAEWSIAKCCSPSFAGGRNVLRKWPQINGTTLLSPLPWDVSHVDHVEPLSVAAFAAALHAWRRAPLSSPGVVLDIGMNAGWYTWLANFIAPELSIIGVDMQPKCLEVAECGLRLQHGGALPENVALLQRFVSVKTDDAPLRVPPSQCRHMASPTAIGGRKPNGQALPQDHTSNETELLPVTPIALGQHLLEHFSGRGARAAVVKIDTEGFETRVLESLRPAWHLLGDVVFELQVDAWRHHGVGQDGGLRTLRELIAANRYRVVTLPHTALGVGRGEAWWTVDESMVDPCSLPHVDSTRSLPPNREWFRGLRNATVMHGHHLETMIRKGRAHGFHEFLLTRRWEGCTPLALLGPT